MLKTQEINLVNTILRNIGLVGKMKLVKDEDGGFNHKGVNITNSENVRVLYKTTYVFDNSDERTAKVTEIINNVLEPGGNAVIQVPQTKDYVHRVASVQLCFPGIQFFDAKENEILSKELSYKEANELIDMFASM